jgi:GGDEF domain-containing protein
MNMRPTVIAILERVSAHDFCVRVGIDDFTCFYKVSNRECIVQRAIDSEVAEQIAERIVAARYPEYDVFVKQQQER